MYIFICIYIYIVIHIFVLLVSCFLRTCIVDSFSLVAPLSFPLTHTYPHARINMTNTRSVDRSASGGSDNFFLSDPPLSLSSSHTHTYTHMNTTNNTYLFLFLSFSFSHTHTHTHECDK